MSLWSSLFSQPLVGLDIGVAGIKAVELSRGKTTRLISYNRIPLPRGTVTPEGDIRNRELVVQAIRKLFAAGFTSRKIAVAAYGNAVMMKKITVPQMSPKELEHQLFFEAEQYIPFPVDEVNIDSVILGSSRQDAMAPMMDVLLIAARKEYVQSTASLIEAAGLDLELIDSQSFALGNVFEFSYLKQEAGVPTGTWAIIDLGAGSTKISLIEGNKTTFSRETRLSGHVCTERISQKMAVSFEDAEKLKINDPKNILVAPIIKDFSLQLADEVRRTLELAISQSGDQVIQTVFICGGGSLLDGAADILQSKIGTTIKPLNPIRNISGSGKKMNPQILEEITSLGAVATGLALRDAGDNK